MPNLISTSDIERGSLLDDYFYNNLEFEQVDIVSDGMIIYEAVDIEYKYLKLENEDNGLLSVLRLKIEVLNETTFYKVDKSKSIIEGKGYATILYEHGFLNLEHPIISDRYQTKKGSADLWHKFITKERTYKVYLYYTESDLYKELKKDFDPYLVWGLEKSASYQIRSIDDYQDPDSNYEESEYNYMHEFDIDYELPVYNFDRGIIDFVVKGNIKDRLNVRLVVK